MTPQVISKVYILTDDQSRIIRCEGGYTTSNITNPENWVQIDEGTGDRYNLCQSHYFEGGLYTDDGILRYKLINDSPIERTQEEINQDRLPSIRLLKEKEISNSCNQAITSGMDVTTTAGVEHFSLQETDQINLTAALTAIQQGASTYPYHADKKLCRMFTAKEIQDISQSAIQHKLYHTTLCNHLLTWIRRSISREEIENISYSAENLPDDLAQNMLSILSQEQSYSL